MSFRQRSSLRRRRDTSGPWTTKLVRRFRGRRKRKGRAKDNDAGGVQDNRSPQGFTDLSSVSATALSSASATAYPTGIATALSTDANPTQAAASPAAVDVSSQSTAAPASAPPAGIAQPATDGSPSIIGTAVGTSMGFLAALAIIAVLLIRLRRKRAAKTPVPMDSSSTEKNVPSSGGFKFLDFDTAFSRWKPTKPSVSESVADQPEAAPSPREKPEIPYPEPTPRQPLRQQVLRKPPATALVREPSTRSLYTTSWQGDAENLLPETNFPEFFSPKAPSHIDHA